LCCDKKEPAGDEPAGEEKSALEKDSPSGAYRSDPGLRHQVEGRESSGDSENLKQEPTMAIETLSTKEKHIIGIGAAIAAGCQPCTTSYVAAARQAGACPRSVRLSIEAGLCTLETATATMAEFADRTFAKPDLDAVFRDEKAKMKSLIDVAAAVASNAATLVKARVLAAKKLGMTDQQIRLAGQIAAMARRGAEKETESALAEVLGDATQGGCGCGSSTEKTGDGGEGSAKSPCGCGDAKEAPVGGPSAAGSCRREGAQGAQNRTSVVSCIHST
jgi:alkylhydroperoxidase/carboxymuconolactone decarboxylase family protein YurZ